MDRDCTLVLLKIPVSKWIPCQQLCEGKVFKGLSSQFVEQTRVLCATMCDISSSIWTWNSCCLLFVVWSKIAFYLIRFGLKLVKLPSNFTFVLANSSGRTRNKEPFMLQYLQHSLWLFSRSNIFGIALARVNKGLRTFGNCPHSAEAGQVPRICQEHAVLRAHKRNEHNCLFALNVARCSSSSRIVCLSELPACRVAACCTVLWCTRACVGVCCECVRKIMSPNNWRITQNFKHCKVQLGWVWGRTSVPELAHADECKDFSMCVCACEFSGTS